MGKYCADDVVGEVLGVGCVGGCVVWCDVGVVVIVVGEVEVTHF